MVISDQEQVTYLANIIFLARVDSNLSPKEVAAIEGIRSAIGAKKATLIAAQKAAEAGDYVPTKVGDFAAQVSNLSDMLYMCFVDGDLAEQEKRATKDFCGKVGVTQDQLNLMVREAIARVEQIKLSIVCRSCKAEVNADSRFCPKCGESVSKADLEPVPSDFAVPSTGYAIEFCESTAGSFQPALEFAKSAPSFTSCVRNKKTWYIAVWPDGAFEDVWKLAQLLSSIRNRKAYHSGKEVPWDQLFGFVWCASERNKAYRPVEYCFGKDENRVNPWGCKRVQMDWTEWSRWFSYGHFRGPGREKGSHVWVFDKDRIRHEVMTNLHRFRYCPYLRTRLLTAVLRALPDEVEVSPKSLWKYSHAYEESPGCIKVVEVERTEGLEFRNEYFADGVRPKGLAALESVLRKAFSEAGITDIAVAALVR